MTRKTHCSKMTPPLLTAWILLAVGCSTESPETLVIPASDAGSATGADATENPETPTTDAGDMTADAAVDGEGSLTMDTGTVEDAATGGPGSPTASAGCGVEQVPTSGAYELDVDGTTREYRIVVPENYDSDTEYKLIFVWHGLGGTAEREVDRNFFGLGDQNDGSAIFVAGQGLSRMGQNGTQRTGWFNRDGEDVNFARALLDHVRSEYCIDNSRVFSTGWSFGGIMTNRLGCSMGEDLRAIAPVMGQGPDVWQQTDCSEIVRAAECAAGQVATWITHGSADTVVPYCGGERSRDYWQEANSCASESTPIGQNGCVEYEDCDDGYPVVWCPTDLGHMVPMFAAEEIWAFFSRF